MNAAIGESMPKAPEPGARTAGNERAPRIQNPAVRGTMRTAKAPRVGPGSRFKEAFDPS